MSIRYWLSGWLWFIRMATIEERAKEIALKNYGWNDNWRTVCECAYVAGATEQRTIDIDKACEWLKNHSMVDWEMFRQAMLTE